ncbi:hypothetical protein GOP47_0010174 [Adiantum capillus-veneris]|uniref:Uncharacterized protein n=1 Tax=Adiantum capillus-veneris TaxID=13818 RepID=A0A9D4ZG32_ADICA|nr:hypothetical protein GOP47_0010174 [Adiantum capillus-veneris]
MTVRRKSEIPRSSCLEESRATQSKMLEGLYQAFLMCMVQKLSLLSDLEEGLPFEEDTEVVMPDYWWYYRSENFF